MSNSTIKIVSEFEFSSVAIYNSKGSIVYNINKVVGNNLVVNGLKPGLYIVRVGNMYSKAIVY